MSGSLESVSVSKKPKLEFEGFEDGLDSFQLVSHDMAVGFAKAIRRLESDQGEIHSWDDKIHYNRDVDDPAVELNYGDWGDIEGYDPENDIGDIIKHFKQARSDPNNQESYDVLKNALEDDIPERPREVIERSVKVLDGARGIIDLQNGEGYDETVEVEDTLWAYEKADGVELDLIGDVSFEDEIRGNEAHKYISNTLTKNAYDNDVDGDTTVTVKQEEEDVITVEYTSDLEDVGHCYGDMCGEELEKGLGTTVSEKVIETFGGDFECKISDDEFNITYELITA